MPRHSHPHTLATLCGDGEHHTYGDDIRRIDNHRLLHGEIARKATCPRRSGEHVKAQWQWSGDDADVIILRPRKRKRKRKKKHKEDGVHVLGR